MKRAALIVAVLAVLLAAAPKGTVPHTYPTAYPAHVTRDGESVGASLLAPDKVHKEFAFDLKDFVVIEVALYPESGRPLDVSLDDFVLRVVGSDTAARPASPKLAAARTQKAPGGKKPVDVYTSVGVGYESGRGYDPTTGRTRGGGVYTSSGVGVGVPGQEPSRPSGPDRNVVETELTEKGLPEGSATAPVAGYLYFPMTVKKNARYDLEYRLRGQKVALRLP